MQRLCRRTIAAQLLTGISVDSDLFYFVYFCYVDLAPVVQRLDNAIHRINHYPVDKC